MATDTKVVRLSHQQLSNLAKPYEDAEMNNIENDALENATQKDKPRRKKPERELYRPGVSRLRRQNQSESDGEDQNAEIGDHGQASPAENTTRPIHEIMEMSRQLEEMALAANEDFSNPRSNQQEQTNPQSSSDSKSKRRNKRPDLQIYVPKARAHGADPRGDNESVRDDTESQSGDFDSENPRHVNMVQDVREMLVTINNDESPAGTPTHSLGRGRGRMGNRGKPRVGSAGSNRRGGKVRGRRSSVGSDGNMSEGSLDMEWDYNADIAVGEKRYGASESVGSDVEPSLQLSELEYDYDELAAPSPFHDNRHRRKPKQQEYERPRRGRRGSEGRVRRDSQSSQDHYNSSERPSKRRDGSSSSVPGTPQGRRKRDGQGQGGRRGEGRGRRDGSASSDTHAPGTPSGRRRQQLQSRRSETPTLSRKEINSQDARYQDGGGRGQGRRQDHQDHRKQDRGNNRQKSNTPRDSRNRQRQNQSGEQQQQQPQQHQQQQQPRKPETSYEGSYEGLVITNSNLNLHGDGPDHQAPKEQRQDSRRQRGQRDGNRKDRNRKPDKTENRNDAAKDSDKASETDGDLQDDNFNVELPSPAAGEHKDWASMVQEAEEVERLGSQQAEELSKSEDVEASKAGEGKSKVTKEKRNRKRRDSQEKPNLQLKVTIGQNERKVQGPSSQSSSEERDLGGWGHERRGGRGMQRGHSLDDNGPAVGGGRGAGRGQDRGHDYDTRRRRHSQDEGRNWGQDRRRRGYDDSTGGSRGHDNRRRGQDDGGQRGGRPDNKRRGYDDGHMQMSNRRRGHEDDGRGREGRGRHRNMSGEGRDHDNRNVGGIIHLPTPTGDSPPVHHSMGGHPRQKPGSPYSDSGKPQFPQQQRGRGRGRGRGGGNRMLFDPNNPTRHLQQQQQQQQQGALQFADPYGEPPHTPEAYGPDYQSDRGYYQGYYDQQYAEHPQNDPYYYYPRQAQGYDGGPYTDETYNREANYHSDYDNEPGGGRSGSANQTKAEHILRDVQPLESQLCNLVSRRINGTEGLQKLASLRRDVQNKYEQVILLDPDLANNQNVEQALWKSSFYQVIEMLRKQLADGADDSDQIKTYLLSLLDEGTAFFDSLIQGMQTTFHFKLDDFLDSTLLPPDNLRRSVKLALLSSQKSMICLGDIARYKELTNQTSNYGRARSWYMKAQQIAPKNGRPYNQLAILALYTRRKLDAVYYYMRSLAASNPFLTARESLMSLFDEARKKAEVSERKKLQSKADARRERALKAREGHRIEIWVSSDGSTDRPGQDTEETEDDLKSLSAVELNKRFVLSFLNVHGKLFTKIGMEFFPEISSQMLYEFDALLQHSPSPIGNSRLLQLMAINMFAIENTATTGEAIEEGCRSLLQEQAVQLGLEMFGLLVRRCTKLFREHLASGDCAILSEDLHQLFPSVKVWSDWMTCHADLWNPPPLPRDPELGPIVDVWQYMADLCNVLKEVDIAYVKMYTQKKEGCDPIVLGEDTMMLGFVPLLSLPEIPMYVHCTVDKEVARDCLRVDKLRTFGDYLCGIEPPMLSYDVETHKYVSVAPDSEETSEREQESHNKSWESEGSKDEDVIVESESDGEHGEDSEHIRKLKAKKEELENRKAEQERKQQSREAVLETSHKSRAIELEITPLFLVPDTNCFVDHLRGVESVLSSQKYTVVVPLVVINELDGLAKGSRAGQYDNVDHARVVKKGAGEAVEFLEAQFGTRNQHLRAMTSKGTQMDTISFRSEERTEEGNNDDLILSCCLHYCQDKARDFMPKSQDEAIRLQRNVVLLTDDRNLRLKAHVRNVPARDIPSFLKWAKIS